VRDAWRPRQEIRLSFFLGSVKSTTELREEALEQLRDTLLGHAKLIADLSRGLPLQDDRAKNPPLPPR
jgi:hypothetical protein